MQRRFTIIEGGLAGQDRPAVPDEAVALRSAPSWRVVLRRPMEVGPDEGTAWRALADRQTVPDPFADPEYLLAAARSGARGADLVFAFAFATTRTGAEILAGVLPLVLPHPIWGGPQIRLWHPPLAARPVEPLLDAHSAADAIEAILHHLQLSRPEAGLRLGRIAAEGQLPGLLAGAPGLTVALHPHAAIPATRFVDVTRKGASAETESVTAPEAMRDAVERFLLLDAQTARRPLIADPAESSIVRVVTRLFAKRAAACVELGSRDGAVVSGAIRLGPEGGRVLWRAVNLEERLPAPLPGVDLDVGLSGVERPASLPLRVVAP